MTWMEACIEVALGRGLPCWLLARRLLEPPGGGAPGLGTPAAPLQHPTTTTPSPSDFIPLVRDSPLCD